MIRINRTLSENSLHIKIIIKKSIFLFFICYTKGYFCTRANFKMHEKKIHKTNENGSKL